MKPYLAKQYTFKHFIVLLVTSYFVGSIALTSLIVGIFVPIYDLFTSTDIPYLPFLAAFTGNAILLIISIYVTALFLQKNTAVLNSINKRWGYISIDWFIPNTLTIVLIMLSSLTLPSIGTPYVGEIYGEGHKGNVYLTALVKKHNTDARYENFMFWQTAYAKGYTVYNLPETNSIIEAKPTATINLFFTTILFSPIETLVTGILRVFPGALCSLVVFLIFRSRKIYDSIYNSPNLHF
jgi:hypothetical protein